MAVVHSFPRFMIPPPASMPVPARVVAPPQQPRDRKLVYGVVGGVVVAALYAGWAVVSRLGALHSVSTLDLAALRFFVSALVLLPVFLRLKIGAGGIAGVPWNRVAVLMLVAGLPYGIAVYSGYQFAPAGHGAVLIAGSIVVFGALFGSLVLGEKVAGWRLIGLGAVVAGIVALGGASFADGVAGQWRGHVLFVLAGASWAAYTVAARAWSIPPVATTAFIAVFSAVAYLPFYLATAGLRLFDLPAATLLLQASYQGIVVGVVAVILYTRVVGWLGAARTSAFAALVPAIATLLAVVLLDEPLHAAGIVGLALVSLGMLASVAAGFVGAKH
ncbi:MAG: DMT family transporter [Proteobacteria bacterium]|nr:DMT family transporter [Pseudomonadota bacterium]